MTTSAPATTTTPSTSAEDCTALELIALLIRWFDRSAEGTLDARARKIKTDVKAQMLEGAIAAHNDARSFYLNTDFFEAMCAMNILSHIREDPERKDLLDAFNAIQSSLFLTDWTLNTLREKLS